MTGCVHNRERTIKYNFEHLMWELDCPFGCRQLCYPLHGELESAFKWNGDRHRESPYLEHRFVIRTEKRESFTVLYRD